MLHAWHSQGSAIEAESEATVLDVEQVLTRLGKVKPAIRTVVEMKVFEGMTAEEIATQLGCAVVTVNRYWQFARHWLRKEWTGAETSVK